MSLVIEHPHAGSVGTTFEFSNDGTKTVVEVETTLRLNTGDPAYDENLVAALIQAVVQQIDKSGYGANVIRLVEIKQ